MNRGKARVFQRHGRCWLLWAALLGCGSSVYAKAVPLARIAVVDSDRILRESAPIQYAQQRLEQEFSKRDHELREMSQRLKTMTDRLNKKGAHLSEAKRSALQAELAQLNVEFQRAQRAFTEDFNQRRNEEIATVTDYANRVIQNIARAEQYDLIVQEAVYFNPRLDITDQVLRALANPEATERGR